MSLEMTKVPRPRSLWVTFVNCWKCSIRDKFIFIFIQSQTSKIVEEESEPKKGKHEKSEPKEGEQEEGGDNEEEEAENEEEENEDSEEGDSDEDSEEEESKGKKKKGTSKIESEEEVEIKEEAGKFSTHPEEIPTRSRTIASPVVGDTQRSAQMITRPEVRKPQPKWLFDTPISKSSEVSAKVESQKYDFTHISTSTAFPSWTVAKIVGTRPTHHPADVSPSDTRMAHHPKWFFNTAKEKSSDRSTKIESPKPTAIFEIPTRKAAATPIPTWPSITTVKPAASVASNKPVDLSSHSDNRKSNSQWFFTTASKPSDGFAKKESFRPAAIEIPTRNKPVAYQATSSWATQSSRPVAPVEIKVPIYKPVEVSPPTPPRKTYPRWFFNIKD